MNRLIVLALSALLISACQGPAPTPPLADARIGGPFALTDQRGRTVRDSDFAGRYRIVYFGYTFCPDVCPVDARNIGAGLRQFEAADPGRGARVMPIFITVDPARDTPAALAAFVGNFHPRYVALTGSVAQIAAVAREFLVVYQRQQSPGATGYLVNHTRQAYLMVPDGKPVALLPADESADAVAAELARWVR